MKRYCLLCGETIVTSSDTKKHCGVPLYYTVPGAIVEIAQIKHQPLPSSFHRLFRDWRYVESQSICIYILPVDSIEEEHLAALDAAYKARDICYWKTSENESAHTYKVEKEK